MYLTHLISNDPFIGDVASIGGDGKSQLRTSAIAILIVIVIVIAILLFAVILKKRYSRGRWPRGDVFLMHNAGFFFHQAWTCSFPFPVIVHYKL